MLLCQEKMLSVYRIRDKKKQNGHPNSRPKSKQQIQVGTPDI